MEKTLLSLCCFNICRCIQGDVRGEAKEKWSGEGGGLKKVLANIPELWDEQQYNDEYDLSGFMKSLTAI